jgi:xanthine dehydrogenase accessory factor
VRRETLRALQGAQGSGRAVALVTPLDGGPQQVLGLADLGQDVSTELAQAVRSALATDRAVLLAEGGVERLVCPRNPPLRLIVVGAVHIAEALCRLAQTLGYAVTVIDPRAGFARAGLFPGVTLLNVWPQEAFETVALDARTAVVLLTHDPKIDDPALRCVLSSDVFYIAALGSTRTQARRLERLAAEGYTSPQLARIHGPAGLAIGARTPAEIALSVLAQMTQRLREPRS